MRDYGRVAPTFWTRGTGKRLRGDKDAQLVALYLMSAPTSNMIGMFYAPISAIANDIGIPIEGVVVALGRLSQEGFCVYDSASETVFVVTMARRQLGIRDDETLRTGDKRARGVPKLMREHGSPSLLQAFWEEYHEQLHIPEPWWEPPFEGSPESESDPIEGVAVKCSTPHRSQDQDQDQDQAQEQEAIGGVEPVSVLTPPSPPPQPVRPDIDAVFNHWRETLMPQAKRTDDRVRRIKARLKEGFTAEQLCIAVTGATLDPWLMGTSVGARKGGYRDVETVLRDAAQVERLIDLATSPAPAPRTPSVDQLPIEYMNPGPVLTPEQLAQSAAAAKQAMVVFDA